MRLKHKCGLVITTREDHPAKYEGDAMCVAWREDKVMFQASYLPSLLKYLDITYRDGQFVKRGKKSVVS